MSRRDELQDGKRLLSGPHTEKSITEKYLFFVEDHTLIFRFSASAETGQQIHDTDGGATRFVRKQQQQCLQAEGGETEQEEAAEHEAGTETEEN